MLLHRHFDGPAPEPPQYPAVAKFAARADEPKKGAGYKAVVYAGTRNLYPDMVTAVKSLLIHTPVDRVFLLIEDDEFPYEVGSRVECINVVKQDIFRPSGPNYHTHGTYMALMKAGLSKIFPDLDRVVSLDVDTIVCDDISELWTLDMGGCYFGAVQEYETEWRPFGKKYWNAGIVVWNLADMRVDGIDDELIRTINYEQFRCPEQDAMNKVCAGRIYDLPVRYNEGLACGLTDDPAIVHYAGSAHWQYGTFLPRWELLETYRALPFPDD